MDYRKIKATEAAAAAAVEAASLDTCWSAVQIEEAAEREDTLYIMAAEGSDIAGVASCVFSLYEAMVENVAVKAGYRRRGIGKGLMARLEEEAARRGVERLCLEVASRNGAAIELYTGCGYSVVGRRKGFYKKQKDDALIMVKEIKYDENIGD